MGSVIIRKHSKPS